MNVQHVKELKSYFKIWFLFYVTWWIFITTDIVFFGESLPPEFYHNLEADSDKVHEWNVIT